MTPERWKRVQALFEAVLELPESDRGAYLDQAAADSALRDEVISLLAADAATDAMLDAPVTAAAATIDADQPLPSGTQLGEYVIEGVLGAGGFGRVYRAVHPVIRKSAAIKVLYSRFSAQPQHAERFVAEARAVNEIGHPDIIDVFAFGETPDGCLYFAMELLDVPTLEAHLRAEGPLSLPRALAILRHLAAAVDAAHERGVIHRDLKPANILVVPGADGSQRPKLLDFGIAKLRPIDDRTTGSDHETAEGQILGTPAYMSPEQARGQPVDTPADVYAFGVIAYQMLTGQLPLHGNSPVETLMRHIEDVPAPPSQRVAGIGAGVDAIVLSMLAKDPAERPDRLSDVIDALDAEVASVVGSAPPASPSRIPMIAAAGAALMLGLGWFWLDSRAPVQAPSPSERPAPVAASPTPASPTTAPTVQPPVPSDPPAKASPLPEDSRVATVEIVGAPAATEVLDAAQTSLGTAPGTIALPHSGDPRVLVFRRSGYREARHTVTPDRDQRLVVTMDRLPRKSKPKLNPDLESPFKP